jgi:peptide chain release factor 2
VTDYQECRRELHTIFDRVKDFYSSIGIPKRRERLEELQELTGKQDFWEDSQRMAEVNQEISHLSRRVEPWEELVQEMSDSLDLLDMALDEEDTSVLDDICSRREEFQNRFEEMESLELLSGEGDSSNAFLTVHPGAGGTESQDWALMLLRMYSRWAEKKGMKLETIDYTPGEEAGIKSATVLIRGDYSFGYLKGESGVHRLVRISPFDANKRRHTSFASVEVIPEISESIEVDIKESELKIDTYRASGAGGQHVNTTDSAVRITHVPTGIIVQCQNERSQHKNRAQALKVLKSRIYEKKRQEQEAKKLEKLGEKKDISWGNQIRSYVFQPYTLVKDHRTGEETGSVEYVFDGDIDRFIYAWLRETKRDTENSA